MTPSGEIILALLRLCPDDETRAAFGLKSQISDMQSAAPGHPPAHPNPYDEDFKNLRTIIDSGQSELIGQAEEVLSRLAEKARCMTRKNRKGRVPTYP